MPSCPCSRFHLAKGGRNVHTLLEKLFINEVQLSNSPQDDRDIHPTDRSTIHPSDLSSTTLHPTDRSTVYTTTTAVKDLSAVKLAADSSSMHEVDLAVTPQADKSSVLIMEDGQTSSTA